MRQKGYTLLELSLSLGIGAFVVFGAVALIYAISNVSESTREHNTVLQQINIASLQIREDLYMALETDLIDGIPSNNIHLDIIDYSNLSQTSAAKNYEID